MNPAQKIPHFDMVDKSAIKAQFFDDQNHRATLFLPFVGRTSQKTLCVIGQNPSAANELYADKTIRYLEELIYCNRSEYGALLVLNLYSRVDTKKAATNGLHNEHCDRLFDTALREHTDFLLVYGKLKREGSYNFPARARQVLSTIKSQSVWKLDIGTAYPPHPGNSKILYNNLSVTLTTFDQTVELA
jgi:hypothetical protein